MPRPTPAPAPSHAKTALITGASSGIGRALAHEFARDGYHLVLAARGMDTLQVLATELRERYGIHTTVIGVNLENPDAPAQLYAEVKRQKITLSALVNNAGFGSYGEFKTADLGNELAMLQLNMGTVVALSKLFLPDLLATRGKLLNTASTAAFQPGPYMAVYCASKAFVLSFSEALAEELAGSGVSVTALCPGATQSGFQDKAAMHQSRLVKGRKLPTSEQVARQAYRAFQRGQHVVITGKMNWLLAQSVRFAPRRVVTRMVKWMFKPV